MLSLHQLRNMNFKEEIKRRRTFGIISHPDAGKTTLTEKLAKHYGWKAEFEAVDDNPYLADFYEDMKRWAFHFRYTF